MSEEKNIQAQVFKPLEQEILQASIEELGAMTSTVQRLKGYDHALRVAYTCICHVLMCFDLHMECMMASDNLNFDTNPNRTAQASWLNGKIRHVLSFMPMTGKELHDLIDKEGSKEDDEEASLICRQMMETAVKLDTRMQYMRQGVDVKMFLDYPELKEAMNNQCLEIEEETPKDVDSCLRHFCLVFVRVESTMLFLGTKDFDFYDRNEHGHENDRDDVGDVHALFLNNTIDTLTRTETIMVDLLAQKENPNFLPGEVIEKETRERLIDEQYQKAIELVLESDFRHEAGRYLDGKIKLNELSKVIRKKEGVTRILKALAWIEYYRERKRKAVGHHPD